jgi:hypothetical protein
MTNTTVTVPTSSTSPDVAAATAQFLAPIVVDLGKARGQARARLVAVGVFLSVISITSKQLVSYMKNVWMLRGTVESLQLADRRFVLEFSVEGDFEHVTRGGPWRYQGGDAVLIRELKEGEDPNMVRFDSMPIWVQFTRIPFYLLSKQLARELGKKLGECIYIDNDARGDICEKIIRVRVRLPIARALQRWITLQDEFSNEEVVVTVLYERLPTFCLCCGVIGHKEADCDLPEMLRRRRYSLALGVPATPVKDPRKWHLPATAGEAGRALQMDAPWRNVAALGARRDPATRALAIVANVVKDVEKLSVHDKVAGQVMAEARPATMTVHNPPTTIISATLKNAIDNAPIDNKNMQGDATDSNSTAADAATKKGWKRTAREGLAAPAATSLKNKDGGETLPPTMGGLLLGKRHRRDDMQLDSNLAVLTETKKARAENTDREAKDGREDPAKGEKEATIPGAAGNLTGATDGACQEQ